MDLTALNEALEASDGAEIKDFLQGDILFWIEECAKTCSFLVKTGSTNEQAQVHEIILVLQSGRECWDVIENIGAIASELIEGSTAGDGRAIVETLEPRMALFQTLCDESVVLTLNQARTMTADNAIGLQHIDKLLVFSEKMNLSALNKALKASDGARINDFLQGDILFWIEECAKTCSFLVELVACNK
jgi:hypothetical protein